MKAYEREWAKARQVTDTQTRAIERRTQEASKKIEGMLAGAVGGFAAGLAKQLAGGLAAIFTGGEFISNTIEAEKAVAQLEAALKATGGVSGFTSGALQEMASSLQKVTTQGDEAIMMAQTALLRFTRVGQDVFPEALKAALNLSAALGTDLTSAAQMVGRALDDPIEGLSRLRRMGIQFTNAQKEQIRALVETGKGLEAQKVILREVEARFGGAAEAARATLGGALQSLKNAFGDLFEVQGPASAALRAEIEKIIAILQDPNTIAAIQAFGALFFETLSRIAAAATNVGNTIATVASIARFSASLGDMSKMSDADMERLARFENTVGKPGTQGRFQKELEQRRLAVDAGMDTERINITRPGGGAKPPPFNTGRQRGGGGGRKDAIEREEDRINKRIKLLEAETATLGKTTEERERARAEAELWAAVDKAQIERTPAVIKRVEELGAAWGMAAAKAEKAKDQFKAIQDAAKDFGDSVSDAFKGMVLEGKSLNEVLDQMVKRLAGRTIDRLFDMLLFGGSSGKLSGGGLFGGLFSAFGGARASGGPVMAGKTYLVGESGPEMVRFGRSGMVTPNRAMVGGGGGVMISPVYNIDATGADMAAIDRMERALSANTRQLAQTQRSLRSAQHYQASGVRLA